MRMIRTTQKRPLVEKAKSQDYTAQISDIQNFQTIMIHSLLLDIIIVQGLHIPDLPIF